MFEEQQEEGGVGRKVEAERETMAQGSCCGQCCGGGSLQEHWFRIKADTTAEHSAALETRHRLSAVMARG